MSEEIIYLVVWSIRVPDESFLNFLNHETPSCFFQSLYRCYRLLSCVSHLLGLCSLRSKMCFSSERSHALWWQSCRRLLSERSPESSGALELSTGLRVSRRGARERKMKQVVWLVFFFSNMEAGPLSDLCRHWGKSCNQSRWSSPPCDCPRHSWWTWGDRAPGCRWSGGTTCPAGRIYTAWGQERDAMEDIYWNLMARHKSVDSSVIQLHISSKKSFEFFTDSHAAIYDIPVVLL